MQPGGLVLNRLNFCVDLGLVLAEKARLLSRISDFRELSAIAADIGHSGVLDFSSLGDGFAPVAFTHTNLQGQLMGLPDMSFPGAIFKRFKSRQKLNRVGSEEGTGLRLEVRLLGLEVLGFGKRRG